MAGKTGRNRGPPEKLSDQLRDAQRLASTLQKAVKAGRATRRDMLEVDRYLSSQMVTKIANILDRIDAVRSRSRDTGAKENLGQIFITLTEMLRDFREPNGYSTLIQTDGSIDPDRLNRLIDIDTELSSHMHIIEGESTRILEEKFSKADHEQLRQIITDTVDLLKKRSILTAPP